MAKIEHPGPRVRLQRRLLSGVNLSVQVGTIDALLARLCIRHDLIMLTTDHDFESMARHAPLRIWGAP